MATSRHVSAIEFVFEVVAVTGFVLSVSGYVALAKVKWLGPARSGRFRYTEAWAPFYARVGPPLLVIGAIGLLVVH